MPLSKEEIAEYQRIVNVYIAQNIGEEITFIGRKHPAAQKIERRIEHALKQGRLDFQVDVSKALYDKPGEIYLYKIKGDQTLYMIFTEKKLPELNPVEKFLLAVIYNSLFNNVLKEIINRASANHEYLSSYEVALLSEIVIKKSFDKLWDQHKTALLSGNTEIRFPEDVIDELLLVHEEESKQKVKEWLSIILGKPWYMEYFLQIRNIVNEVTVNGVGSPIILFIAFPTEAEDEITRRPVKPKEMSGRVRTNIVPTNKRELELITDTLIKDTGRRLTIETPIVSAYLRTGDRIEIIGDPVAPSNVYMSLRIFPKVPRHILQYLDDGLLTPRQLAYMSFPFEFGLSVLVSGGTGSGKTTLLNALTVFIPESQFIVSAEEVLELNIAHPLDMWRREQTVPGKISYADLIKSALRQNPDWIFVQEIRMGEEMFAFFEAISTGHAAATTIHADTPDELMVRLTSKFTNVPPEYLRNLDFIFFVSRYTTREGRQVRKVRLISEVLGVLGEGQEEVIDFVWRPNREKVKIKGPAIITSDVFYIHGEELREKDKSIIFTELAVDLMKKSKPREKLLARYGKRPFEELWEERTKFIDWLWKKFSPKFHTGNTPPLFKIMLVPAGAAKLAEEVAKEELTKAGVTVGELKEREFIIPVHIFLKKVIGMYYQVGYHEFITNAPNYVAQALADTISEALTHFLVEVEMEKLSEAKVKRVLEKYGVDLFRT